MAEHRGDRVLTPRTNPAADPDRRALEDDKARDERPDEHRDEPREEQGSAEGRDRPPANRGRDPNGPWLGGG